MHHPPLARISFAAHTASRMIIGACASCDARVTGPEATDAVFASGIDPASGLEAFLCGACARRLGVLSPDDEPTPWVDAAPAGFWDPKGGVFLNGEHVWDVEL